MKRIKGKKPKRPEFEGKSRDYQDGYEMAEEYFNYLVERGNFTGAAPFRIFVEAVAVSIRNKEKIGQCRIEALGLILKYHDSDFNRGVYEYLMGRIKEYNAVALIDEVIESKTGVGKNAMPEV